ncbi:hypothetical protein [Ornithinibacillus scapharcae]|uniref:hypothetical protein n=1 Tax=Ornithinibacillus scapharcae TaxID=1147159 RepID=UPI000225BD3B|nr:hypothetical protein [Ornithinibacillus scapharcae]
MLFYLLSFHSFYLYKKRKVKWYEPLRDSIIIYLGILLGIQLSPDERAIFQSAVQGYAMMTIGSFLFLYYGMKLYSWFQKIGKAE